MFAGACDMRYIQQNFISQISLWIRCRRQCVKSSQKFNTFKYNKYKVKLTKIKTLIFEKKKPSGEGLICKHVLLPKQTLNVNL